jgi:hypothetical protein
VDERKEGFEGVNENTGLEFVVALGNSGVRRDCELRGNVGVGCLQSEVADCLVRGLRSWGGGRRQWRQLGRFVEPLNDRGGREIVRDGGKGHLGEVGL